MAQVGFATLQVIPSLRGLDRAVTSQLGGPMTAAGRVAGRNTSRGFASSLANGVQGTVAAVSKTLRTGLTIGAVGAGAFAASALAKGFSRLTTIEDATSSLRIQLGSSAKAAVLLNKVLGVVKGTPFNLDQFASAAANLVGMGVEAQKIPGYLTAIGEASATKGKRANEFAERLANVFGTVSAQGRIMGGDINEIAATGVNALAILANHFGVTTDKMREMVSDGAVPANVALDVLSKGIISGSTGIAGSTVALGGTMEGLRKTLTGSIGGLGAAVARIGAAFLQPFSASLTTAFTSATDLIDKLTPRVQKLAETIAGSAGFERFTNFITGLPAKITNAIGSFKGIASGLAPVAGLLAGLASTKLSGLLGPLGALVPAIGPVAGGLLGLVATSPQLREALGGIADAAKPLLETFSELASTLVSALAPIITQLAGVLTPALKPIVTALSEVATALGGAVVDSLKSLAPAAVALVAALVPILPIVGQLAADLITGLAPVLPQLAKAFSDLVIAVTPLLPPLLGLGVALIDKIGVPTIVALAVALGALATAITPLVANTAVLTPLVFGLGGAFAAVKGVQALQAGILGLAKAGGTAVGTLQRLGGNASSAFKAFKSGASTFGRVASGILDMGKSALIATGRFVAQAAAFVAVRAAALAHAVATKAMAAAQWLLNAAMTANPIGLLVVAIAALAAGVFLLYKKFKPVRVVVDAIGRAFATVARVVTGALAGAFEWIKSNWPKLLLILTGPIGLAILAFKAFGPKILSGISTAFGAVVGFLTGLPARILGALGSFGSLLVNLGGSLIRGLWNGITAAWTAGIGFLTGLPGRVLRALGAVGSWLLNVGGKVIGGLWRGIKTGWDRNVKFWSELPGKILRALGAVGEWLWDAGWKILIGLGDGIIAGAGKVLEWFGGLKDRFLRGLAKLGKAARWLWDFGWKILIGLGDGIIAGAGAVLGWLGGLKDRFLGAIGNARDWLFDVGHNIIGGLLDGIKDALGGVKDFLGGVGGKIVSWKGPPAKDAKLLIPTGGIIMGGLVKGIASELPALQKQLSVVSDQFAKSFAPGSLDFGLPKVVAPVKSSPFVPQSVRQTIQHAVDIGAFDRAAASREVPAQLPPLQLNGPVYTVLEHDRHILEMIRQHSNRNPHAPITR